MKQELQLNAGLWQDFEKIFGTSLLAGVNDRSVPSGGKLLEDEKLASAKALAEGKPDPGPMDLAKTPSAITNGKRHRISCWTDEPKSEQEIAQRKLDIARWSQDPRHNILLHLTSVRAIDIDVPDHKVAAAIEENLISQLGVNPPVRMREGVGKRTLFVRVTGNRHMRRAVVEKLDFEDSQTGGITKSWGSVEFLGQSQQSVIAGRHGDGSRYYWERLDVAAGMEAFPEVSEQQMQDAFAWLAGIENTATSSDKLWFGDSPVEVKTVDVNQDDPIVQFFASHGWLGKPASKPGWFYALCPNRGEHTSDTDWTSSTLLMASGTDADGQYLPTRLKCEHAHCARKSQQELLQMCGYAQFELDQSFKGVPALEANGLQVRDAPVGKLLSDVAKVSTKLETNFMSMLGSFVGRPWQELINTGVLDRGALNTFVGQLMWNSKTSRFDLLDGDVVRSFSKSDVKLAINLANEKLSFINHRALNEIISSAKGCSVAAFEKSKSPYEDALAMFSKTTSDVIISERQAKTYVYASNPLETGGYIGIVGDEGHIVIGAERFDESGYDPGLVNDFKEHCPYFDDLITVVCAARFASNRKVAYVWLHWRSDSGKSLLLAAFKQAGLMETPRPESLLAAASGKPSGLSARNLARAWAIGVDEFQTVSNSLKLLDDGLTFNPKNEAEVTVPLYAKVFASHTLVRTLMSADGIIDTEFGNRFMYMPMSADIKLREKFMQDRDAYRRALSAYIAKQANEYVQAMRGLDKGEISRRADRQLSAMFDKHMLSKHGTKIESTYRDTISDFSNWLIDTARSDLKLAEFGSTQMKRRFVYVDKHKSLFYKVGSGGFEEFCRTKDMDVAKKMLAEKDTLLREMGAPVRVHCGPMGGAKGVAVVIRIVGYTWSDVVEATIGATTNEPEGQEFVF